MMRQATYAEIRQALTDALEAHGHMGRLCDGQILACPEWGIRMRLHTMAHKLGQEWGEHELPIHVLVEDVDAGDASRAMVVRCLNPFPKESEATKYQVDAALQDAAFSTDVVVTAEAMPICAMNFGHADSGLRSSTRPTACMSAAPARIAHHTPASLDTRCA